MDKILHGDSLELLKDMEDNTIDSIVTDPPYGYSFMGKDWDKAVPSVELWEECLRVLKPGGFAFIMSAPRADVQSEMIKRLEQAGFRVDFTPIYWTYATGFPKAANMGKLVDKRLGVEREVIGERIKKAGDITGGNFKRDGSYPDKKLDITIAASDEAKALDGSYAGYQPKPAVEVVIVVMKPLTEGSFLNQAMKNGKGVTWLEDLRIPFAGADDLETWDYNRRGGTERTPDIDVGTTMSDVGGNPEHKWGYKKQENIPSLTESESPLGRFAANLLVQNDVLNTEEDEFTRYFDMDAWWEDRKQKLPSNIQATYPFMIVPKASKGEKNKGLDNMDKKVANSNYGKGGFSRPKEGEDREIAPTANFHPTVKPISLMSYLVTMGSRENDLVLDPFVGSGTTCIAAKLLNRKYLGMELNDEYAVIAQERIKAHKPEKQEHDFF
jgi:site-specific DNA-methyltransferase (adenine-specific)